MPETLTAPLQLVDIPLEGNALLRPISCALSFYDGAAFTGLPHGQIGDHGAVVRTETLVIRTQQITDAYGSGTPECFKETPDWSAYPPDFHTNLQNDDDRLGFVLRDEEPYVEGWYRTDVKNKYDFQDGSFDYERGLVVQSKDCFDNLSAIVYDDYAFLPVEARQYYDNITPEYLSTSAEYDYRLFKPVQVNDENDNRSRFDYSPLGLLKGIALIGQYDKDQGDIVSESPLEYVPSTRFEYDLMEFYDSGKPVWVKTIQRELHWQQEPSEASPTIQKIEFSDGFGRILQSRAQAEDLLFGPTTGVGALTGDSGLPADQSSNANSTARNKLPLAADNVVVNGWKVYNNKGKVVEEYEPFFSTGYVYQSAKSTRFQLQKMSICYDAGGRPTQTTFPDGSCSLVVYGVPDNIGSPPIAVTLSGSTQSSLVEVDSGSFTPTPWERYAYDQNDLGPLTSPSSGGGQGVGSFTPKSELIDALGRTIKTTEHKSQPTASMAVFEDVVMTYLYDIQGNLIFVKDPYDRQVFHYKYNLQKQPLCTIHIDSGISRVTPDALGKPIEATDAKSARTLSTYDRLQRPVYGWSKNNNTDMLRMTLSSIYGEGATTPQDHNLLGKLYEQYDESGKLSMPDYDFKGNLLTKVRNVISATEMKLSLDNYQPFYVDWTPMPSILDSFNYQTDNAYDALNRITSITLPEAVDVVRRMIQPFYNRAGALERVVYDNADYVTHIGYNAKGQRLLIAFGNNVMTRYAYDPVTFRLLRQRSEKFTKTQQGLTVTYAYDVGTNRQDDGFDYDLVGNILSIISERTDCGITGSSDGADKLTRSFTYDPMYRLLSATGRESDTQNENDYLYADAPAPGSPNADNVRAYLRRYSYDKLGNIQQMRQSGSNAFTRNFSYFSGVNQLRDVTPNSGPTIESFTYDNVGNQITAGSTRHYQWDAANQLLIYKNQTGSSDPTIYTQYQYAGGNRVSKLIRTGTDVDPVYERVIYIDGIFEHHKLENGTTYEKNYVQIMDDKSRICEVRVGTPFPDDIADATTYILEDQIGSSVARLKTDGSVIDREEYYPFGDSSLRTFSKKRYRYVGKEKDLESGLYYYGARYYAAWTCRFISVDPLAGKYPNLSGFLYAHNNPIRMNDPTGMEGEEGSGGKVTPQIDTKVNENVTIRNTHAAKVESLQSDLSEKKSQINTQTEKLNTLDQNSEAAISLRKEITLTQKEADNISKEINIQLNLAIELDALIKEFVTDSQNFEHTDKKQWTNKSASDFGYSPGTKMDFFVELGKAVADDSKVDKLVINTKIGDINPMSNGVIPLGETRVKTYAAERTAVANVTLHDRSIDKNDVLANEMGDVFYQIARSTDAKQESNFIITQMKSSETYQQAHDRLYNANQLDSKHFSNYIEQLSIFSNK